MTGVIGTSPPRTTTGPTAATVAETTAAAADLSAEVQRRLLDVVADGFTLYCCGSRTAPAALVACYEWDHYVDLLTIRDFARITAARVPRTPTLDVFSPTEVVWAYEGPAEPTLRALWELVHPDHPDAPRAVYPALASLTVPRRVQRPMTIRMPPPGTAGRAARLSTGLPGAG